MGRWWDAGEADREILDQNYAEAGQALDASSLGQMAQAGLEARIGEYEGSVNLGEAVDYLEAFTDKPLIDGDFETLR